MTTHNTQSNTLLSSRFPKALAQLLNLQGRDYVFETESHLLVSYGSAPARLARAEGGFGLEAGMFVPYLVLGSSLHLSRTRGAESMAVFVSVILAFLIHCMLGRFALQSLGGTEKLTPI